MSSAARPGAAPLRVVLDTNVLLSLYVFADSRFAPLRAALADGRWRALTRPDCLAEFARVLAYPQFDCPPATQDAALADYRRLTETVAPPPPQAEPLPRCKDPDDQKFLEVARDGRADWLVTADKALLKLARRKTLRDAFRILPPEQALAGFVTADAPSGEAMRREGDKAD